MATVVIVGRKNVGKSTLFNRLTGRRISVVYKEPGVTRDRVCGEINWRGRTFDLIDTGGFYPDESDNLTSQINRQIDYGIKEADIVLFVVDGRIGLHPVDEEIAGRLRKANKRIILLVNKIDRNQDIGRANDFTALGFEKVFPISAEGGFGLGDVMETIHDNMPGTKTIRRTNKINIVILGRPNSGKSTLLNSMIKKDRAIVDERPGTTRDLVTAEFSFEGKNFQIVDTCGLRRISRVRESVEFYAVVRSLRAINAADIAVLLFDVTEGVVDQDRRIASLVMAKTKGLIFAPNKIDRLGRHDIKKVYRSTAASFEGFDFVPIVPISAREQIGVDNLMNQIVQVHGELRKYADRRVLQELTKNLQPPVTGALLRINQVAIRPPIFKVRLTKSVEADYIKYLRKALRNHFGYAGAPVLIRTEKINIKKAARQRKA